MKKGLTTPAEYIAFHGLDKDDEFLTRWLSEVAAMLPTTTNEDDLKWRLGLVHEMSRILLLREG